MQKGTHSAAPTRGRRIGLIVAATVFALGLTVAVVLAQTPNFDQSYKSGPAFADAGDVITYTIVVVNTGDPVEDVVLSDTLPGGVTLLNCSVYTEPVGTLLLPCDPTEIWTLDFGTGERITTTVSVQVDVGTLLFPLFNTAHVSWDSEILDLSFGPTVVNPVTIYMPIIARNAGLGQGG